MKDEEYKLNREIQQRHTNSTSQQQRQQRQQENDRGTEQEQIGQFLLDLETPLQRMCKNALIEYKQNNGRYLPVFGVIKLTTLFRDTLVQQQCKLQETEIETIDGDPSD